MPVEYVDTVHPTGPVVGCASIDHLFIEQQSARTGAGIQYADIEVAGMARHIGLLNTGDDSHRSIAGKLDPLLHISAEIRTEKTGGNDHIHKLFPNPGWYIQPNGLCARYRVGHPHRKPDGFAAPGSDAVQLAPALTDELCHQRCVLLLVAYLEIAGYAHEIVMKPGYIVALTGFHQHFETR